MSPWRLPLASDTACFVQRTESHQERAQKGFLSVMGIASFFFLTVFFLSDLTLALKRFCLQSCHPSLDLSVLKSDCVKNEFLDFLFITFINKCRLSYVCPYTPCEIACINICAHVKDPVVHVRVRWIK